MNRYLQGQINNMIAMAGTFLQGCEMAAKQDDGTIQQGGAKTARRDRRRHKEIHILYTCSRCAEEYRDYDGVGPPEPPLVGGDDDEKESGLLAAFAWWKQVADIGKTLYAYDARAGGNPTGAPSIPIDLGAAQSPHGAVYGGQLEMLDLSWYTPYKKTVDDLVSGFLWLFFLWALFRHAPAVISGVGLTASRSSDIAQGHKGRGR